MKKLFRNALLVGSLLLSSTASVHADREFSDIVSGMVPTLPIQGEDRSLYSPREGTTPSIASKYLAQHPFNMKMVKKVAGSNTVFTLDTMHEATDGAYILLRQSDLKSADSMHALQAVLQKPTDVHVILDVEADSAGVLNLYSVAKKEASDGSTTLRRVLPYIKHLHLINSAQNVKTIGSSFLYGDKYLEDITFTGFETVKHINDGFMLLCKKLKSADLSSFENLKSVDSFFMSEASSLTTLKLHTTRFFNADLTSVGDHFLRGTKSLTHTQEAALESVTHIGDYFMSESGVTKFNTGKFKELKELGRGFLSRCSNLAHVNVSGLKRIAPAKITVADATIAQTEAKEAKVALLSTYREAWTTDAEAQDATTEAANAERGALKHAEAATATIKGIVAKGKERAAAAGHPEGKVVLTSAEQASMLAKKESATTVLLAAKDAYASSDAANAEADRKVEITQTAHKKAKELAAKALTLSEAAHTGQRHNLGLLYDCAMLKQNPDAIRGAWDLLESLRNQLHIAYPGLTYEDDTCGC